MKISLKILRTEDRSFQKKFSEILRRGSETPLSIETTVRRILKEIRKGGDQALLFYTKKLDRFSPHQLEVSPQEIRQAYQRIHQGTLNSLRLAAQRIRSFHKEQARRAAQSWSIHQEGIVIGEEVRPVERVGLYVPGGLAAYPSTVLMNAIPARIAGVQEIIMVSPWRGGMVNPHTLVAADIAGVDRIFKIGGAQAIAALAFGTEMIPAVDKIVGPGNIYVATAKRLVFGQVGIDMIAGPTEIVIIADDTANPCYVASDLLSQAEHDPMAVPILLTPSSSLARQVTQELERQLSLLERREILQKAISHQGRIILTSNNKEAVGLANQLAPEHLSLQIKSPRRELRFLHNAGAIFLGPLSAVAFGDYLAGPNHVLPTSRTARFSSPLGVSDFLKRSSVIEVKGSALKKLGPHVRRLACLEGLTAHAASVQTRMTGCR